MSCGYQGRHFGARYEDAICIDGYLWDLDSCEELGGRMLTSGGEIPCPRCRTKAYVLDADVPVGGNAHQRRLRYRQLVRKVLAWAAP